MQMIELELNHNNFFCPATGEYILKEDEDANHDASSLMGYWLADCIDDPFIKNSSLQNEYDLFLKSEQAEDEDFRLDQEELEKFLANFVAENWVVFKITSGGFGCSGGPIWQIVYFVIDMNTVLT
jgi:hypothetical protein